MQLGTNKNIQPNILIATTYNHQELIFGDSKYLFYDSNQSIKPKSRLPHRANTGHVYGKKHSSKVNFSVARPQTTVSCTRRNVKPKNFKKLSNCNKQNGKLTINLNFKQQKNEKQQKQKKPTKEPLNKNQNTKNKAQTPQQIKNSPTLSKKTSDNISKSPKKDKNNVKFMGSSGKKQKSIKLMNQKQKEPIPAQTQTIHQSRIQLNHDKIRQIFGCHHIYFKANCDYLRSQHGPYSCQQIKLQKQISNLKSPTRIINPSFMYGISSKLFTNSFFCQSGLQRASILQYIKNSSTKKLFNILVGQNISNQSKQAPRYSDPQFSHEKTHKINNSNIQWIYIKPGPDVKLFSDSRNTMQSTRTKIKVLNNRKQLLFVKFLRFLYFYQPELISRLYEPPINNVYSVWLFINGCYQPIFIDGYFPLDEKLNHFYGSSPQYLWLPILIKCICKINDTYCLDVLSKITIRQVYKLLTGIDLQYLDRKVLEESDEQFVKRILRYLARGYTPLLFSSDTKSFQLLNIDSRSPTEIVCYNPTTQQTHKIQATLEKNQQIVILPPFLNWFIYCFQISRNSLNKFQLQCQRNIQFVLSAGINQQNKQVRKQKRIYIYQCQHSEKCKKSLRTKLILKYEGIFIQSFTSKLKRGSYKIFIEQGQKKIHLLLADKKPIKWQQKEQQCVPITMSLFTTQEVKLSDIEQLQRRGQLLQDSENFYHKKKQE